MDSQSFHALQNSGSHMKLNRDYKDVNIGSFHSNSRHLKRYNHCIIGHYGCWKSEREK